MGDKWHNKNQICPLNLGKFIQDNQHQNNALQNNRLYLAMRVYSDNVQRTSKSGKNVSHATCPTPSFLHILT